MVFATVVIVLPLAGKRLIEDASSVIAVFKSEPSVTVVCAEAAQANERK